MFPWRLVALCPAHNIRPWPYLTFNTVFSILVHSLQQRPYYYYLAAWLIMSTPTTPSCFPQKGFFAGILPPACCWVSVRRTA